MIGKAQVQLVVFGRIGVCEQLEPTDIFVSSTEKVFRVAKEFEQSLRLVALADEWSNAGGYEVRAGE